MKELVTTMPSLVEIFTDPVSLIILAMYGALMLWEMVAPARKLPSIKYWKIKGMISFVIFFILSTYLPLFWDKHIANYQIFDLTGLGTWGGAFVGIVVYELGLYFWHRTIHKSDILWRIFHQMHHSAERLDSFGAFYFSPMDMIGFTLIGSLCLVGITGFTPEASTIIILGTTFLAIFQHSNISTPYWLGYLIQRPEAHTYHHAKGIHAFNYADLSIIDIIFGTFHNPKKHEYETGFYQGGSNKIFNMLLFKDITKKAEN